EPHPHLEPAGREPREEVDGVRARLHIPQREQHHHRPPERQRHQAGGEPPGLGLAEPPAEQQQDRGAQSGERGDDPDEIEQVAGVHAQPFSSRTSSAVAPRRRRKMATMIASPTATSAAATTRVKKTMTWPPMSLSARANVRKVRLAALRMGSAEADIMRPWLRSYG